MSFEFSFRPFLLASAAIIATSASAEAFQKDDKPKPWRLNDQLETPGWLRFSGDMHARMEMVDNQFRRGAPDPTDQALLLKSHLRMEADAGDLTFVVELEDARAYFDDERTALSTGVVNALDFLEANIRYNAGDAFGAGTDTVMKLGRQAIDQGSRRVLGRNIFRNTTNAFTGLRSVTRFADGDFVDLFLVSPVRRLPDDDPSLQRNDIELDEDAFNIWFANAFYHFDNLPGGLKLDTYIHGYFESDTTDNQTENRNYYSPGARLWLPKKPGAFDFEAEYIRRFGTRRATDDPTDVTDLTLAGVAMLHAEVGYTIDWALQTRFTIEYDHATGDKDPNDNRYNRHDNIFNLRRPDLGNNGIFGPLSFENLEAFGSMLEWTDRGRWSGRAIAKATWRDSAFDELTVAELSDPDGSLSRYTGFLFDGYIRYWAVPDVFNIEFGWSVLTGSDFRRDAEGSPSGGTTAYGYTQLRFIF